ncbi:MAG: TIGR02147 family protein [Fibrobacteria bacterium]|nr:TIGR02147 family protein [Fibrobacteria bacterium]
MAAVSIYDYYNYREFLRDLYKETKEQNSRFSCRYIAQKAGFSSTGFFTKIIQGKTNISFKTVLGLAKVFKLKKHETTYFELLVQYTQAKTHDEKKRHFERVLAIRRSKVKDLDESQYALFNKWYYGAIRELLDFTLVKDDVEQLAKLLNPPITTAQAKDSLKILEQIGLIQKNPDGYYERSELAVSTGKEWSSLAITNFQKMMLNLAELSFESVPKKYRDISTLTLSISSDTFKRVQERLSACRREILEMAKNDNFTEHVYQVNMQVFPLTNTFGKGA